MTDWYKIKRILVGTQQVYPASRLPSAYQEVEYIENSWTQYIKTNLDICTGYRNLIKARFTVNTTDAYPPFLWGYLWYSWGIYYRLYWNWRVSSRGGVTNCMTRWVIDQLANFDNTTTRANLIPNILKDTDYEFDFSWISWNEYLKVDGETKRSFSITWSTTLSWKCCILGSYSQDWNPQYNANPWMRCYYSQFYDSNWNLVADFIPCYRTSDNVIGMYDLVNNQFYTNSWSGTFTKWPNV